MKVTAVAAPSPPTPALALSRGERNVTPEPQAKAAAPSTHPTGPPEPALDGDQHEQLQRLTEVANAGIKDSGTSVTIERHKESGRYVFKLLDQRGEVIRQNPPEALLRISERLADMRGVLLSREG